MPPSLLFPRIFVGHKVATASEQFHTTSHVKMEEIFSLLEMLIATNVIQYRLQGGTL